MLNEFRSTHITWDKATSRIYSTITANESDENGRKLVVQIINGGESEDLTGAALHLYWETRDKAHDGLDVFDAVDLKKGEFELSYTTGMLSNKGILNANLVLIDTVGRVVSERFKITVTEGIDNDAIQSENSFSSLTQALIDISNLEQNYAPRLNDLTAQLQQKADKSQIGAPTQEQVDMWLTANPQATTTVQKGSVTKDKLAFTPVVGKTGKNLFDKSAVTLNKNIATTGSTPGTLIDGPGLFVSDFIPVSPSKTYAVTRNASNAFVLVYLTADGTFVSSVTNPDTFTPPETTVEIRFRSSLEVIDELQIEEGDVKTPYEPYRVYPNPSDFPNDSFEGRTIKNLPPTKLDGYAIGKNKFDKDAAGIIEGYFVTSVGSLVANAGYNVSDFIPLEAGATYTMRFPANSALYDPDKVYVSGFTSSDPATFTAPTTGGFLRTSVTPGQMDTQQVEKGSEFTSYENFGFTLAKMLPQKEKIPKPFLKLSDARFAWQNGEKFPVAFQGDSQTDGNGTTGRNSHEYADIAAGGWGRVDHRPPNAYPQLLENLIREETKSTTARIYNVGYSGTQHAWARPKLDEIFGHVYADTKMVGMVYGTNDRGGLSAKGIAEKYRKDVIEFIHYFYDRNIQPFMVTTQAAPEPDTKEEYQQAGTNRFRNSESVHSIINQTKREIAEEYDLELVDMNYFSELFMTYSSQPIKKIVPDGLHFTDAGHKAEAEYIFSHFFPRTIRFENDTILSFTTKEMVSKVPSDRITMLDTIDTNGFKVIVNYTKDNAEDMVILDFWVLNDTKGRMSLKSFVSTTGTTYVKVNGVTTVLTTPEQLIANNLDIGLHHIQAFTGLSDKVDFKGFKLTKM